jgi:hypothetical protein
MMVVVSVQVLPSLDLTCIEHQCLNHELNASPCQGCAVPGMLRKVTSALLMSSPISLG